MERLTMSCDDKLAEQFDQFIAKKGYTNRSEAMRDLIRQRLEEENLSEHNGSCVAILSYVYNHHEMELASRMTQAHHQHHELTVSSVHVHMDHDNCLEIAILRGKIKTIEEFSDSVMSVTGVRHGKLSMVPVEVVEQKHVHGDHDHAHVHHQPKT